MRLKKNIKFIKLAEPCLHELYDFIYHIFRDEELALEISKRVIRIAERQHSGTNYSKYFRLWLFRLAAQKIQKRYPQFLREQVEQYVPAFHYLNLNERLIVFLVDRLGFTFKDVAAIMVLPEGHVSTALVYGREKIARAEYALTWEMLPLQKRIQVNENLNVRETEYALFMSKSRQFVASMPQKHFAISKDSFFEGRMEGFWASLPELHWSELPWQYKIAIETLGFGIVGLLAIVILPWLSERVNFNAVIDGRMADVFVVPIHENAEVALQEISTERLLASATNAADANDKNASIEQAKDEFADMDFPSGDMFEVGAAPVAPSRTNASVYRLIVQSPSPVEMATQLKEIFDSRSVKERNLSGSIMPGGVYFDGVTTEAEYLKIKEAVGKIGTTHSYASQFQRRRPDERARVIVWIQQI